MPRIKVEMTEQELKAAVVEWAKAHHGMDVAPEAVTITTKMELRGYGIAEHEYHSTLVKFETN